MDLRSEELRSVPTIYWEISANVGKSGIKAAIKKLEVFETRLIRTTTNAPIIALIKSNMLIMIQH